MMVQLEAIEFVGASASNGVEMRAATADAEFRERCTAPRERPVAARPTILANVPQLHSATCKRGIGLTHNGSLQPVLCWATDAGRGGQVRRPG
ncbi:hypothetical protein SMMN14_01130 [Sphaerulina musiva]